MGSRSCHGEAHSGPSASQDRLSCDILLGRSTAQRRTKVQEGGRNLQRHWTEDKAGRRSKIQGSAGEEAIRVEKMRKGRRSTVMGEGSAKHRGGERSIRS